MVKRCDSHTKWLTRHSQYQDCPYLPFYFNSNKVFPKISLTTFFRYLLIFPVTSGDPVHRYLDSGVDRPSLVSLPEG